MRGRRFNRRNSSAAMDHRIPVGNAHRMFVQEEGDARGRPVVLVHGNPASGRLWDNVAPALAREGFRVIRADMIGLGRSDKPHSAQYHSLTQHGADLATMMEVLDLQDATLVLHDWGGPIGLQAASQQPRRVRDVVITNTMAYAPREQRTLSKWHGFFGRRTGQWLAVAFNLVPKTAWRHGVRKPLSKHRLRIHLAPFRNLRARRTAAALVAMVPDGPDHPTSAALRALEESMARHKWPALVLWADADPVFRPRHADHWHQSGLEIRDILHVSKSAGHFWQEDDPEPFLDAMIPFLRG